MTTDDYRRALATAIREYETLGQQRQDVDRRLAEVAQTIGTLSRLCGLTPTVPLGLTDACRLIVRGAGVPLDAHRGAPAAAVDRVRSVEIRQRPRRDPHHPEAPQRIGRAARDRARQRAGKHSYLWHHGPHAVALGADIAAFMRDANLEREAMAANEPATRRGRREAGRRSSKKAEEGAESEVSA